MNYKAPKKTFQALEKERMFCNSVPKRHNIANEPGVTADIPSLRPNQHICNTWNLHLKINKMWSWWEFNENNI